MTYTYTDRLPEDFALHQLRTDVRVGLTATPKWLPPKWFYDKTGSDLFEQITELPEYYPTRAEASILRERAAEIVGRSGARELVELGSGSSTKTRMLLDALVAAAGPGAGYVALDVSESALRSAAAALADDYAGLVVHAVRADFEHDLGLSAAGPAGRRLVAFLGGTIGNFEPASRAAFLARLQAALAPGDRFLLGADLVKSPAVLVPAYDDAAGVTAAFNLNVLSVVNHVLGADFDPTGFRHVALWDARNAWIEMRLQSQRDQVVDVAGLDLSVPFAAGEHLRTEISAKFTRDRVTGELAAAGFAPDGWWTDAEGRFSLSLWKVV
ncbi:L-histidine N(alpha)-methyltransferase [Spongisporangium articulatum]|uniref:Histidine N-alpha-methyltransferase n=1 Tax=Spongisporangium articulatum TaxID=3362603 RepID=A0ABW8ALS7_9ACTN